MLKLPAAHQPGRSSGWIDAVFMAASAASGTGLTVFDPLQTYSRLGELTLLFLFQIGGVGLMATVTLLAVALGWRVGIRQRTLIAADLNQASQQGAIRLVLQVLFVTAAFQIVGAAVLYIVFAETLPAPQAVYFAFFHAASAFCNAGFDLLGGGMAALKNHPVFTATLASLFFAGSLGFVVIRDLAVNRRWSKLSFHSKVVLAASALLTAAGTLLAALAERGPESPIGSLSGAQRVWALVFQIMDARSAGFQPAAADGLSQPTLFLFLFLMFVGGAPGSTAGGIKVTTFAALLAALRAWLRRKSDVELGRYRLNPATVDGSLAILLFGLMWIFGLTFALLLTEGADLTAALFEAASATGTVGLSAGLTEELSETGKLLMALSMLTGKAGPIALALTLGRRGRSAGNVKRPEKRLVVG